MADPYQLRRELLFQAQSILKMKYDSEMQKYHRITEHASKNGRDPGEIKLPSPPTEAEIVKVANKLYEFVKTK